MKKSFSFSASEELALAIETFAKEANSEFVGPAISNLLDIMLVQRVKAIGKEDVRWLKFLYILDSIFMLFAERFSETIKENKEESRKYIIALLYPIRSLFTGTIENSEDLESFPISQDEGIILTELSEIIARYIDNMPISEYHLEKAKRVFKVDREMMSQK